MLLVAWLGLAAVAGATSDLDSRILLALRQPGDPAMPRGPQWLLATMRDVTALGDATVLTLVTTVAAGLALTRRRIGTAAFIALTAISGAIADTQVKLAFGRPRPTLTPHLVEVASASFPSGHAMNAAVVYLTLAALLAKGTADRRARAYFLSIGIGLSVVIGVSRVYLGVHYPTDVIGGWLAGAAWAAACWTLASHWHLLGDEGAGPARALPLAAHPAKAREP